PLMILSLWIGVYPKPFLQYIQQPVNAIVKQIRPDYQIPGTAAPAQPERAEISEHVSPASQHHVSNQRLRSATDRAGVDPDGLRVRGACDGSHSSVSQ